MNELPWFYAFDHLPLGNATASAHAMVGEGALTAISASQANDMTIVEVEGRRQCRTITASSYAEKAVVPTTDIAVGLRCRLSGSSGLIELVSLRTLAGTNLINAHVDASSQLHIRQGTTVIGTIARSPTIQTERYVEICVRLGEPGTGSVHVKVDGTDELIIEGLTLGVSPVSTVRVGGRLIFTDLYIRRAPAEGSPFYVPIRLRRFATLADLLAEWSRNGGTSNAEQLRDPNGSDFDATTIETQTVGTTDECTLDQLPPDLGSILAVIPYAVSVAPAGGAPQIRLSLVTDDGVSVGPDQTVGVGGYRTQMAVHTQKPGGGEWNRAAVNSLRLKIEAV